MKLIALLSLAFGTIACLAGKAAPSDTRPWYHDLRPGVTRAEVQRVSGFTLPAGDKVEIDAGTIGRFEFEFRNEILQRAQHFHAALPRGSGDVIYGTYNSSVAVDPAARRAFLQAGKYDDPPPFAGPRIRTRKYNGYCYEVDGQYIVAEPIAEHGTGHFTHKHHRILLVDANGTEKILFHAKDHWNELRPPNVSAREAARREEQLRRLGKQAIGMRAADLLGQEDSQMGSGVDYRLYYLPSALAVVHVGGNREQIVPRQRPDFVQHIIVVSPGGESRMTFEEWLRADSSRR